MLNNFLFSFRICKTERKLYNKYVCTQVFNKNAKLMFGTIDNLLITFIIQ